MPYYVEVRFAGGDWQRNPTPFPTRKAAEEEGAKVVGRADPEMEAMMREANIPDLPAATFRVINE